MATLKMDAKAPYKMNQIFSGYFLPFKLMVKMNTKAPQERT